MEMHQVRYFLAVARTRNFTRAAEECNVAQPSLTRAIKQLEDELGGELFRRERPQAQLTDLGQHMLPLLQQCFDSAASAKSVAGSIKAGKTGALRLALSRTIDLDVVMPHLLQLRHHFPDLDLKVMRGSAGEVAECLKRGDAELGIAAMADDSWERFDHWPLFTECFHYVVHSEHRLANSESIPLDELKNERFLRRPYCEHVGAVAELLRNANITIESAHEVWSERDLMKLIEANFGFAILPSSTLVPATARCGTIEGLDLRRTVYLYGVAGRQRTAVAAAALKLLRAFNWSAFGS